ncbi:hypothetical protein HDV02_005995 [Globomyces sp. JEL0801]|nr:hypothetical protein HDV02_005995 [Globomyces sp. JEL0801]
MANKLSSLILKLVLIASASDGAVETGAVMVVVLVVVEGGLAVLGVIIIEAATSVATVVVVGIIAFVYVIDDKDM